MNHVCRWNNRLSSVLAAVLIPAMIGLPLPLAAQTTPSTHEIEGVIVGRVYEIDKAKYEEYKKRLEQEKAKPPEKRKRLDPDDYLVDLPETLVIARQLASNFTYQSEFTNHDGDYMIKESPTGAYDFKLIHDEVEYTVSQRLDLNVELSYIAELCFVVDRQEKKAWIISEGLRRDPEAPPFVPQRCRSALSACLLMLTGNEDGFPDGLILLLAGSGAAAAAIGVLATTDQTEASPPRRQQN
jgi:hypothetical protein